MVEFAENITNVHEEQEQYADSALYTAFKRGVGLLPQVDTGGAVECGYAIFENHTSLDTHLLRGLTMPLTGEQLHELRMYTAHAHADTLVYGEAAVSRHVTSLTDESLLEVWQSMSGKGLSIIDNFINMVRSTALTPQKEARLSGLTIGKEFMDSLELWLDTPEVYQPTAIFMRVLHETLFSDQGKEIASQWKKKIRQDPRRSAYEGAKEDMVFEPFKKLFAERVLQSEVSSLFIVNPEVQASYVRSILRPLFIG